METALTALKAVNSWVLNSLKHIAFLLLGNFCAVRWESFPCPLHSSAWGADDAQDTQEPSAPFP